MKRFIHIAYLKSVALTAFLLLISVTLQADEFKVISFEKVPNDVTAIMNNFKRYDDNDELCAIIKVRTDLPFLHFTASNPIVGKVEFMNGEYWVYLSGGTRQLSVYTEGFIKFSYNFPVSIESGKVYLLVLSSKSGGYVQTGKGTLIITSSPNHIKVGIDGFPDLVKETPCSFENYRAGKYQFKFNRLRYHPLDSIITIEKNTQKQIHIRLKPTWGNLIVSTNMDTADFQFNGQYFSGPELRLTGENYGPEAGTYNVVISKEKYHDVSLTVSIGEGDTSYYEAQLLPVSTTLRINTVPQEADVYIDGHYAGTTPFVAEKLIIGNHTVRIRKRNFVEEERNIFLEENQPAVLDFTLRNRTKVTIETYPAQAKVWVNGEYLGKTPLKAKVSSGEAKISIKKDHYEPLEKTEYIDGPGSLHYNLKKQKYRLTLKSNPPGATVKVNHAKKGETPEDIELPYGSYRVTVEKDKHFKKTKKIGLKEDRELSLHLTRRLNGYIGFTYTVRDTKYDIFKIGVEIGWTYKNVPRFMTGFGYQYGMGTDISSGLPDNVKIVNASMYNGLNLNSLAVDGFYEEKANLFYLHLGVVIPRPFVFAISINPGAEFLSGYKVNVSDGEYTDSSYGETIYRGDRFIDSQGETSTTSFILGVDLFIPFGSFYISGNYWISNTFVDFSPKLMFGLGYSFR